MLRLSEQKGTLLIPLNENNDVAKWPIAPANESRCQAQLPSKCVCLCIRREEDESLWEILFFNHGAVKVVCKGLDRKWEPTQSKGSSSCIPHLAIKRVDISVSKCFSKNSGVCHRITVVPRNSIGNLYSQASQTFTGCAIPNVLKNIALLCHGKPSKPHLTICFYQFSVCWKTSVTYV